jgi:hypothetical protein
VSSPSVPTIKRLFAVSGNRCAFPQCVQALVHLGKVTGRICHIKAASPEGPRYDKHQTEAERHGFDNLILMCPIHHDVIDVDVVAYTVDRLRAIKAKHESTSAIQSDLPDELATQMIVNLGQVRVEGGSVIITHNQSGGQAAHVINNFGPPPRSISPDVRARVLSLLAGHAPGVIGFASTQGDTEAHNFKDQLMALFRDAGWDSRDMQTFMVFGSKKGLVLTTPFHAAESGTPQLVAQALQLTGGPVSGNRGDMANECQHYVQVWHAP